MNPKERVLQLNELLKAANYKYYVLDNPILSYLHLSSIPQVV